jgi:hypothetical protein
LWLGGGDARLPDFSDYICHRAFQRGFFYGYSGDFPSLGAVVSLPRFSEDGGGVRRQEETLLIYDEIWYKEELQKAMEPGLGNLLSHQGAVGIGFEPIRRVSFDAFWFFRYGLIVAFGLSPLVFAGAGRAFRLVRFVKNSEFRRKQQEA